MRPKMKNKQTSFFFCSPAGVEKSGFFYLIWEDGTTHQNMMLFTCSSADWSILSASSDICSEEEVVDDELTEVDDDTLWLTDEKLCMELLIEALEVSDTRCSIRECASFWELSSTRLFTPSSSTTWLTPKHTVLTKRSLWICYLDFHKGNCWWEDGFPLIALLVRVRCWQVYQQTPFWKKTIRAWNRK